MGKWIHRLSNLDLDAKTATCHECGDVKVRLKVKNKRGNAIYRCYKAHRNQQRALYRPWSQYKEDVCSRCGFVPEHPCQLDVDHINGDKTDNSVENLQTLCANCHRLKTFNNKDWENKSLASI
jgi:5-methylcytosine-specific restriction endonuclease McrA